MERLLIPSLSVVVLRPYGRLHPVTGTVKDSGGNPVARKLSIWIEAGFNGLHPAMDRNNLHAVSSVFWSETDGTFSIPFNEYIGTCIVIAYGQSGENHQIVAKIDLGSP